MDLKTLFEELSPGEKILLSQRVPANLNYLFQISGGHRKPSPAMARRLVAADPRLTLEALRPDIWGEQKAA